MVMCGVAGVRSRRMSRRGRHTGHSGGRSSFADADSSSIAAEGGCCRLYKVSADVACLLHRDPPCLAPRAGSPPTLEVRLPSVGLRFPSHEGRVPPPLAPAVSLTWCHMSGQSRHVESGIRPRTAVSRPAPGGATCQVTARRPSVEGPSSDPVRPGLARSSAV